MSERDAWAHAAQGAERRQKETYRITHPSPMRQYLPRDITTAWPGPVRRRSPRMMAPLAMMVFPPRMMFCGPEMVALRETLFPVSYTVCMHAVYGQLDAPQHDGGVAEWEGRARTVSMYSARV